jgi:DNA-binding response OmpR family regulator
VAPTPYVLVIDDDPALLDVLNLAFDDAGLRVGVARDGREGLAKILADRPDLVVSDVAMPGLDGFELCRRLRGSGVTVPFVMLTSRDSEIDEALALDLGADDYVTKPFSTRVLVARVRALLRREEARAGAGASPVAAQRVGALELDPERIEVRLRGACVVVTMTEFRLLQALTSRPGVVFSRQQLLEHGRGDDTMVTARVIDTYVRRLRRKFEAIDGGFDAIETVIGAGYRWRSGG